MDYLIVGDWGTSNLRLYLINKGSIIATKSGLGIKSVQGHAKEHIYDLCAEWLDTYSIKEVSLCGMAGSRLGIIETDYLTAPLAAQTYFENSAIFEINSIVFKQSFGVRCINFNNYPDVIRGEEMQIFGALDNLNDEKSLLILPGTHSKWVKINRGAIEQFQTYPSGELFDLLQNHSTMGNKDADFDKSGFDDGIDFIINNKGVGGGLLCSVFAARTFQLLESKSANWAKGFLSGIIIASEISENQKLIANYPRITLIGAKKLCENYQTALDRFSMKNDFLDGNECSINGLLKFAKNGKK